METICNVYNNKDTGLVFDRRFITGELRGCHRAGMSGSTQLMNIEEVL